MRLAAEYQQRTKKQQQKQESGRRYIVKLGKGLPNEQRRKRGISISQANSNISEQSLGRNEVSKEKQREQILATDKRTFVNKRQVEEKVVTSMATYSSRPQRVSGYAAEHLLDMKAKQMGTVASTTKYLSGVKSQQNLRQNNHLSTDRNSGKIFPPQITHGVYVPPRSIPLSQARPLSRQPRNLVEINSKIIQNPSNLRVYEAKPPQNQQVKLFLSNPASKEMPQVGPMRVKSGEPIKISTFKQCRSQQKIIFSKQPYPFIKEELIETTRNTEKLISTQRNDPYNSLSSLKMTKKNDEYQKTNEELKQTKKFLKGVPQCKEFSSSNASADSRSNPLFSRTGLISLWDANKVESILSMKESRQIKVQESEIMHDYFNPSESMLNKF